MNLDGAAWKWFLCSEAPTEWENTPAVAAAPRIAAFLAVPGLRTRFLEEFQKQHYKRYQETRLRHRKQGIKESRIEYFYDIIDLCRKIDLVMSEEANIGYVFKEV